MRSAAAIIVSVGAWTLKTARKYRHPSHCAAHRSVSMAAHSAQQSTTLAPGNSTSLVIQQTAIATPRSRRVSLTQRSILVTPDSHVRTPLTPINSRGSYRVHKRIPRQTLHNRKKLKLNSGVAKESEENSHHLKNAKR